MELFLILTRLERSNWYWKNEIDIYKLNFVDHKKYSVQKSITHLSVFENLFVIKLSKFMEFIRQHILIEGIYLNRKQSPRYNISGALATVSYEGWKNCSIFVELWKRFPEPE